MKYLNSSSALCSQEPPTVLIIFVLTAWQLHHLWAPLRGRGNLLLTSCTTLEWQEIQGKGYKGFSLTPSHVYAPLPCSSMALPPLQTSRRRKTLWGAPKLKRESPWCLPWASSSSWRIKLDLKSPTRQKQDLPSSRILPYSLKIQGTFSLSKILALPLLPEVFKGVGSLQKLDWAVDDSMGGELGATSKVRKRGTSVVSLELYLTTAEPVAPQEFGK